MKRRLLQVGAVLAICTGVSGVEVVDANALGFDPAAEPAANAAALQKALDGDTYVLAVNATTNDVVARIKAGPAAPGKGFVMHEERNVKIDGGGFFEDAFGPFAVHIYRIPAAGKK